MALEGLDFNVRYWMKFSDVNLDHWTSAAGGGLEMLYLMEATLEEVTRSTIRLTGGQQMGD